jgi:DNA gyrase subunit B
MSAKNKAKHKAIAKKPVKTQNGKAASIASVKAAKPVVLIEAAAAKKEDHKEKKTMTKDHKDVKPVEVDKRPAPKATSRDDKPASAPAQPGEAGGQSPEQYDADAITVLKGLEAVQRRPAMYIGDTSVKGFHHLAYEVVDNSVDEALAGHCDTIEVHINADGSCTVEDNGRGIPVDIHKEMKRPALEVVMTVLHAGGKFDKKSYKVSGGLHGVGVSVVNALAEWLEVHVARDGNLYYQKYERGAPVTDVKIVGKRKTTGTKVTFMPDANIFGKTKFNFDILTERVRELAFLNKNLKLSIEDARTGKEHKFQYKGGIAQFVQYIDEARETIMNKPIYLEGEREGVPIEIALQYNDGYNENIFTYVNNIHTIEGGSHLVGFKAALTKTINTYAAKNNLVKEKDNIQLTGDDAREA